MSARLYDEFAAWWPVLSDPADYVEEATFYADELEKAADGAVSTVLELGSGGGNNASHMKRRFHMTLVDPAPGMLAVSRALNPGCEHIEGDMRSVRLGRTFDGVFIHDAICYMTTPADLRAALETALAHLRPGGAAVFAPDFTRETFVAGTDCGGEDGDGRALRYLEWTWDPDPSDSTYTVAYAYLLRDAAGNVRVEHDRHIEGLFAREEWLVLMRDVGFEARIVPFRHPEVERPVDVLVGKRADG